MDASEIARLLGHRGGKARAARLSATDRQRIAALGGRARAESLRAERRIRDNFRYLSALRELQGPRPAVRHSTQVEGRLPGIYPTDR
jgi:hypothetical protein